MPLPVEQRFVSHPCTVTLSRSHPRQSDPSSSCLRLIGGCAQLTNALHQKGYSLSSKTILAGLSSGMASLHRGT